MSNSQWISISSVHNETLKTLRALLKPTEGRKQGVFVVEGLRAAQDALYSHGFLFGAIIKRHDFDLASLGEAAQVRLNGLLEKGLKAYSVNEECFASISDTVTPQGIIVVLKRKKDDLEKALASLLEKDKAPLVCVMASLRDPGNAGTIMRTADALAVDMLIATDDSVDLYAPKCVRAEMGSTFHIPFVQEGDFASICSALHAKGFTVLASSGYGKTSITKEAFDGPTALVIGNEANGLTDAEIALADKSVYIPMPGQAESFNAAMAAGLLMYQAQLSRNKLQ